MYTTFIVKTITVTFIMKILISQTSLYGGTIVSSFEEQDIDMNNGQRITVAVHVLMDINLNWIDTRVSTFNLKDCIFKNKRQALSKISERFLSYRQRDFVKNNTEHAEIYRIIPKKAG